MKIGDGRLVFQMLFRQFFTCPVPADKHKGTQTKQQYFNSLFHTIGKLRKK
jgi:hypothetical protein